MVLWKRPPLTDNKPNKIGPQKGMVREGTILEFDETTGEIVVGFPLGKSDTQDRPTRMGIPAGWVGPDGEFSGGYPKKGTSVWCAWAEGGQWSIVGYGHAGTFGNKNTRKAQSYRRNLMSAMRPGRWLTQVRNNIRIICDPTIGIQVGNPKQFIHANPKRGILSNTFSTNMAFTEASRQVIGPIKRDVKSSASTRDIAGSALTSHAYDEGLKKIGLDPDSETGDSLARNPAYVEKREIVYEFEYGFGFTNDQQEIDIYDTGEIPEVSASFNRTKSRYDTLNLSLNQPNFLIEKMEGTMVDIYGNILDLNRQKLPVGIDDRLSFRKNQENLSQTFRELREVSRKGVAFHWEMNARHINSDLKTPQDIPDVNVTKDYARDRSRFFIDVDKEGQFKINVPASSEKGNVALLTRYENYSRILASQEETDPEKFERNRDNTDVFVDGHGVPAVKLTSAEGEPSGLAGPVDRINDFPVYLGTGFHDVAGGLFLHKVEKPIIGYDDSILNQIAPVVEEVVSDEIFVGGDTPNAGGRSGTIALDGSLAISIGANTIDRQSLWLDLAGGIVANIGRDRRNVSAAYTLDGDLLIQVGGAAPVTDSRFEDLNNANRNGVVDIRVLTNNMMHVVRIDTEGVTIHTPQRIDIVSEGELRLKSVRGNMYLDAENIFMYPSAPGGGRLVNRKGSQTI